MRVCKKPRMNLLRDVGPKCEIKPSIFVSLRLCSPWKRDRPWGRELLSNDSIGKLSKTVDGAKTFVQGLQWLFQLDNYLTLGDHPVNWGDLYAMAEYRQPYGPCFLGYFLHASSASVQELSTKGTFVGLKATSEKFSNSRQT